MGYSPWGLNELDSTEQLVNKTTTKEESQMQNPMQISFPPHAFTLLTTWQAVLFHRWLLQSMHQCLTDSDVQWSFSTDFPYRLKSDY